MKRFIFILAALVSTAAAQIIPSTGNVRGPTSATDNAIARFDGTTGKLVQNSGVTVDDSGNLTVSGTGTNSFVGLVDINNDLYIGAGNILSLSRNNPTYNTIKRDTSNGGILLTANSNTLFFKDNGNLGIGTTSPIARTSVLSANVATTNDLVFTYNAAGDFRNGIGNTFNSVVPGSNEMAFLVNAGVDTTTQTKALSLYGNGNATFAGNVTVSGADKNVVISSTAESPALLWTASGGNTANRNWRAIINNSENGDWGLYQSTTAGGTASTKRFSFNQSGDATFAGTVKFGKNGANTTFAADGTTAESGIFTQPNTGFVFFSDYATATKGIKVDVNNGGLTVLSGGITTATAGGSAGTWKLGVANTVSPTSPNRTITIDIGGTTYYLAAKTTND